MRVVVFMNERAGTAQSADDGRSSLEDKFREAGLDAEIRRVPGAQLCAAAQAACAEHPDAIVAGGGDGTVSAVASALVDTKIPLGVLPLGTLNHFAKDLGIPLTTPEALSLLREGRIADIDVGEANGHIFLNNSSLGVYPRIVLDRDAQRGRHGMNKWLAMLLAILKAFRRFPLVEVRLSDDKDSRTRKTPLVFVGNNRYQLDLLNVGTRACLDRGELSLYVANVQSRWGLLRLTFRALLGRLEQDRDFETLCLSQCWIETRRRTLHVAFDGEVEKMSPPLHYRARPGALRVFLPRKAPAGMEAGA
jgi:diacylglycerol kinase family enzyme